MCQGSIHIMYVPELSENCLTLIYSSLSADFDDVIPQQPALSNDGKQQQPALSVFTSPIDCTFAHLLKRLLTTLQTFFHVKIKFYQGWWMTKKVQKIVFEAKNCSKLTF
jgi:hypothetical protein